jgi:UDP-GlcNAc:undecaprenyl-phosphate GlcNAc-1-phosphate transferase
MIFLTTLLISVFTTIALIPVCSSLAVRLNILDIPNERKVHVRPIPRSGGIAMAMGTLLPILLTLPFHDFLKSIVVGCWIVVMFGLLDDSRGLPYKYKFAAQIAAALVVIFFGGVRITHLGSFLPEGIDLPVWLAVPLTVVAIVGVTNAINLSDGLDGLAGGISILTFLCIAYLSFLSKDGTITLLSIAVIGAIFGFLRFNTHPANLFMGDSGSQFLGFLAVSLCLKLTQTDSSLNRLLPLMLMGLPILDTLSVMIGRIARGKSPFLPDKNHLHHRFVRLGLSHAETVSVLYVLQSFLVTCAFLFRSQNEWFILFLCLGFGFVVLSGLAAAEKTGRQIRWNRFIDEFIRQKIKTLKKRYFLICTSFGVCEKGLPLLLLLTVLLPVEVPVYVTYLAACLIVLIVLTWFLRREWLGGVLRMGLYLFIPYAVYLSEKEVHEWIGEKTLTAYNLFFGILVLFIILTLKFTRRQKGFKTTPLDFLILFVALVVPNLPDALIRSFDMSLMATKIIVFFFGYEVLMGELRGEYKKLALEFVAILLVVTIRGFFSI